MQKRFKRLKRFPIGYLFLNYNYKLRLLSMKNIQRMFINQHKES